MTLHTSDFDYHLPPELIAQTPAEPRDSSRLLVLHRQRSDGWIEHRGFRDLTDYLRPGDLMVFNRSRVIPARLHGRESRSGATVEVLLVRRLEPGIWQALGRPGRRLRVGAEVTVGPSSGEDPADSVHIDILATHENGLRTVRVSDESRLDSLGELPLPPYIKETPDDPERYQTVYADNPPAVSRRPPPASTSPTGCFPTSANWVSPRRGSRCTSVSTPSVPCTARTSRSHKIHTEWFEMPEETADAINRTRSRGRPHNRRGHHHRAHAGTRC